MFSFFFYSLAFWPLLAEPTYEKKIENCFAFKTLPSLPLKKEVISCDGLRTFSVMKMAHKYLIKTCSEFLFF